MNDVILQRGKLTLTKSGEAELMARFAEAALTGLLAGRSFDHDNGRLVKTAWAIAAKMVNEAQVGGPYDGVR